MKPAHFLFIVVAVSIVARAAIAATLVGTITNQESGDPLPFASVRVETPARVWSGLAGPAGDFRFDGLPAGSVRVDVSYLGYSNETRKFELAPDQAFRLDVGLTVQAIRMETQEVEGDRKATDQATQTSVVKFDAEDLARIPAAIEADPIRALQLLPGVQAASDISSGLYVRGGGPDQNLVLLDRVPVYNPTHAFGLFSTFNPDAIGGVTLYKGAYPAEYGGRLGAVLDIENRRANRSEVKGQLGVSSISARLRLEGPVREGGWSVSARRTYLDPLLAILRRTESEIPSYWFYDLNGKLTLPVGPHRWEFSAYGSRDRLEVDLEPDAFIGLGWGNVLGTGTYRYTPGETVSAGLSVWASRYSSTTELDIANTPVLFENRLLDVSAGGDVLWRLPPHHRLKAGVTWSNYDFSYFQEFNQERQIDYSARPDQVSAFLEDIWTPRITTSIRGGLRSRYVTDGDRVLVEPRISLRQNLDDRWALKAAGGLYHQYLQLITTEGFTAGDLYLPIDATAQPSRSVQSVLGLEFEHSRRYNTTVEVYYTDLSDLVTLNNDVPVDQASTATADVFHTGGTGYATGLELFAERRTGAVTGWLGYGLGWTRRQWDELNQGKEFPPKYDRRHDFKAVLQWQRGKWRWGATLVYGTGQAFTPASARYAITDPATGQLTAVILSAERNTARLLPYHRLDLSLTRQFDRFGLQGEWFFQVFNAYNRRNDWFVSYNTPDAQSPLEVDVIQQLPMIPSLGLNLEF